MTAGLPPFYSENTNVMYKKILHNQLTFPPGFSPDAQSLIRALLIRDPKKRLGGGKEDAAEIKRHSFFADIDWDKLLDKQVQPPYKPKVTSETDVSNFDPAFTEGIPVESLPSKSAPLSEHLQDHFKGFSYVGESVLGQSPAPASNHPLSHRMGHHTLHALTPMTPISSSAKSKSSMDMEDFDY
jgi:serum/glucocorticoid-regulated kinase 2